MVNEIYESSINTKENIDGREGVKDIFYFPQERIRFRNKTTKIYKQDMLSSDGLHFDRNIDFWDNNSLKFDGEPIDASPILIGVISPSNTLIEDFRTIDDINTTNTTGDVQTSSERIVLDDTEILESKEVVLNGDKYIKDIRIASDNSNLDYYIKYTTIWIPISSTTVLSNGVSHKFYYRAVNNSGSQQIINKLTTTYSYWEGDVPVTEEFTLILENGDTFNLENGDELIL